MLHCDQLPGCWRSLDAAQHVAAELHAAHQQPCLQSIRHPLVLLQPLHQPIHIFQVPSHQLRVWHSRFPACSDDDVIEVRLRRVCHGSACRVDVSLQQRRADVYPLWYDSPLPESSR